MPSAEAVAKEGDAASSSTAAEPKYDAHTAAAPKYDTHTAAAPKYDTHTAAAPKYDEHTAVVAKDSTPQGPSTPIGAGDQEHTTTIPGSLPTTSTSITEDPTAVVAKEPAPEAPSIALGAGDNKHTTTVPGEVPAGTEKAEHEPVEGYVAPKENPEDEHLIHAGAAYVGAAVAGAELIGQKLVGAVHPHAAHAREVGQQSLQGASDAGASYIERAKHEAERLRQQATDEANRRYQEADKLAHETVAAAQAKAAAAQAAVTGVFHRGQEQAQQNVTHAQSVVTGQPADGAPNKEITPLPVTEAPVAPSIVGDGKNPVPGAAITTLPASEAPVREQEGVSNRVQTEANAVVPIQNLVRATGSAAEGAVPVPNETTTLPASEAPVSEPAHASNAVPTEANAVVPAAGAGVPAAPAHATGVVPKAQTSTVAVEHEGKHEQVFDHAPLAPTGVTRTSSSYGTSALTAQEPVVATSTTTETVPVVASTPAGSTGRAARSSSYSVPDRSPYEGGSLSPNAMKRASNAEVPPPVAEKEPPMTTNRTNSSDKALPTAPGATFKEENIESKPAPSEPSTPSKREEFSTAPTTPAAADKTGSAPPSPSPGVSEGGGDKGTKKRGFFSRLLKKDK